MGHIAVGFDGTLVYHDEMVGRSVGKYGHIIDIMVDRVREWLDEDITVKIVTPRVNPKNPNWHLEKESIEIWCEIYLGKVLEVTCEIGLDMTEYWNYRAISIIKNTGNLGLPLEWSETRK
jgi:hypothetical protein